MTPTFSCPMLSLWGWCWLSGGMIQLWRGRQGEVGAEVLVQQAAVFFCTITCSIIVLWITSIAGDNRQAAKRSGWHRTPVWIISRLPADCLQEVGVLMCGQGSGEFQWALSVLSLALWVELTAHLWWLLWVTAADLIASLQLGLNVY